MADNTTLNPGTGGDVIATDDIAGVKHQLVKVEFGDDGAATQVSATNRLPVADQHSQPLTDAQLRATAVPVSGPLTDGQLRATPVPISGTVTASGPLTDAQLRATAVPVSGPLTDAQLRATAVPVSASALPLPTGAATESSLSTVAGATALEDTAASAGFRGVPVLAVRRDVMEATAADGDFSELQVNSLGRLKVTADPALQDVFTGNITSNTGTLSLDVSRTSNISFTCVNTGVSGATFNWEFSLNSTNGTDGNWYAMQAVQTNANTIGTSATSIGATPTFGWEASVNGYRWFRIRASAGTFGTSTWTIQPAPFATEPIPAAQISGTQPVSGTVTANIGTGAIAAGTNAIGDVGVQYRATTTGAGTLTNILCPATPAAQQLKGSAGRLISIVAANSNASTRWLKIFNILGASVTPGVTNALAEIAIPGNQQLYLQLEGGAAFSTAITIMITGGQGLANNTAVTSGDVTGVTIHA